jgi:hypothetical protein
VCVERRGERRGGCACGFAEWPRTEPSFHVSFRPSPHRRGGRRGAGRYARYSTDEVEGRKPPIGVSGHAPRNPILSCSHPLSLISPVAADGSRFRGSWRRRKRWGPRRRPATGRFLHQSSSHFPNLPPATCTPNSSRRWFSSDLGRSRPALSRQIRQLRLGVSPSSRWRATTCTRPQVRPADSTTSVCVCPAPLPFPVLSLSLYLSSWRWIGTALRCRCILTRPCSAAVCVRLSRTCDSALTTASSIHCLMATLGCC